MDINLSEATFPHVSQTVTDNSTVSTADRGNSSGTVLNCPLIADRGNDTATLPFSSTKALIKEYGRPNFKKHGQPIYNAMRWLDNSGLVEAFRLKPTRAALEAVLPDTITFDESMVGKYSNAILVVKIHHDEVTGEVKSITEVVSIDVEDKFLETGVNDITIQEKRYLVNYMQNYQQTEEIILNGESTARTFRVFPIFALVSKGHGKYGDGFSFTISPNKRYDDTNEFRVYNMKLYEKTSSGALSNVGGSMLVSFYPEAYTTSGTALFVEKVINTYNTEIECQFCESKYNELAFYLNQLNEEVFLTASGEPVFNTVYDIDFLFGMTRGADGVLYNNPSLANPIKYDVLNNIDVDYIDLTEINAARLANGSDGAFASDYANRAAIIDAMYGAYFDGILTADVYDKTMFLTDVILDAGFTTLTKSKMANFAKERFDCVCINDSGFADSVVGASLWRDTFDPNSCYSTIFSHAYTVYDEYTNSDITVTSTYVLAGIIPALDSNKKSVHLPFVGPRNGRFTDFKSVNFVPTSTNDKETMYQKKLNYVERDKQGYYYNSQLTTQAKQSALSNLNNVRVLCRIMREIGDAAKAYYFAQATSAELSQFQNDIDTILSKYLTSGACSLANGAVTQSQYEKETNSCSVNLNLTFYSLLQNFNINYVIGQ